MGGWMRFYVASGSHRLAVAHHVSWGEGIALWGACIRDRAAHPACQAGAWPRAGEQARDLRHSPGPRGGHAATETDRRQPRQPTPEVPETNGSNAGASNRRARESIDTVGVRSSILRSPTLNPPESGGFSHVQAVVGPRWGRMSVGWRWIGPVRVWPRMGQQNFSGSLEGGRSGAPALEPLGDWRRWGATGVGHG